MVERGLTSTEGGSTLKVRRHRVVTPAQAQAASTGIWERILPAQVRAIALKDLNTTDAIHNCSVYSSSHLFPLAYYYSLR